MGRRDKAGKVRVLILNSLLNALSYPFYLKFTGLGLPLPIQILLHDPRE